MKKIIAALVAVCLAGLGVLGLSTAASANDGPNQASYWNTKFEHPATCYKHEANPNGGSSSDHGSSTGNTVTLNTFNPAWGDHWEALIVKAGSTDTGNGPGNVVYVHPSANTAYAAPEGKTVSHWIVCKGTVPDSPTASASISVTPPTCESAGVALATGENVGLVTLNQTPGTHSVTFTANENFTFPGGSKTKVVSYTILPKITGVDCYSVITVTFPEPSPPTCLAGAALPALPLDTDQVDWSQDGNTFTATAKVGFKFAEGPSVSRTYTLAGPLDPNVAVECQPEKPENVIVYEDKKDSYCTEPADGTKTIDYYDRSGLRTYTWNTETRSWVLGEVVWNVSENSDADGWVHTHTATRDSEHCEPTIPEPKVEYFHGGWVDGEFVCNDTTVSQTRVTWSVTTTYTWEWQDEEQEESKRSNGSWVLISHVGDPVYGEDEHTVRDLTEEERTICVTPIIHQYDKCGYENDGWDFGAGENVGLDWSQDGQYVTFTATDGYVIVAGNGFVLNEDGSATFDLNSWTWNDEACPTGTTPPAPQQPKLAATGLDLSSGAGIALSLVLIGGLALVAKRARRVTI